jgi:hypothetical protein
MNFFADPFWRGPKPNGAKSILGGCHFEERSKSEANVPPEPAKPRCAIGAEIIHSPRYATADHSVEYI